LTALSRTQDRPNLSATTAIGFLVTVTLPLFSLLGRAYLLMATVVALSAAVEPLAVGGLYMLYLVVYICRYHYAADSIYICRVNASW
jgi:hypothetical protein